MHERRGGPTPQNFRKMYETKGGTNPPKSSPSHITSGRMSTREALTPFVKNFESMKGWGCMLTRFSHANVLVFQNVWSPRGCWMPKCMKVRGGLTPKGGPHTLGETLLRLPSAHLVKPCYVCLPHTWWNLATFAFHTLGETLLRLPSTHLVKPCYVCLPHTWWNLAVTFTSNSAAFPSFLKSFRLSLGSFFQLAICRPHIFSECETTTLYICPLGFHFCIRPKFPTALVLHKGRHIPHPPHASNQEAWSN